MVTRLTKTQWGEILTNPELTNDIRLSIFQTLYSFDGYKASASQVGYLMGYTGKTDSPLTLEIVRYAKKIAKYYDIQFTQRNSGKDQFWDLFFEGWFEGKYFIWQLKSEIVEALIEQGLTGERPYAEELPDRGTRLLTEGAKKIIIVNTYERIPQARDLCIKHWGTLCSVCNFDFYKVYGDIGSGFVHVHHLVPISEIGESYQLDPINDLRPVCPNCHAMLHTSTPPLSIEELKKIIKK